jgi:short-subunit dehydrogenase
MGEIATPFSSTYSATKAALTRFSDALRMELSPFNINVVIIKPGGVKSDIANNAKEKTEAYA